MLQTKQNKFIGEFKIVSGIARVSDPCYKKDTWCNGTLKVKNGTWMTNIVMFDEGDWGDRVGYLIVRHKDYSVNEDSCGLEGVDFEVGVDSGQVGVFDDSFFKDDESVKGLKRMDDRIICEDEPFYSMCCDRTLHDGQAGVIPYGAISSSGYGDGRYDCHIKKNKKGEVIAIIVDFDLENEEDK